MFSEDGVFLTDAAHRVKLALSSLNGDVLAWRFEVLLVDTGNRETISITDCVSR